MDFICSDAITKAQLKLSVQTAADQSMIILGELYRMKVLLKGDDNSASYIEKMVIKNGNIYYQTNMEPGKIHSVNAHDEGMTTTEFYAPSYLNSITTSYSNAQFLKIGQKLFRTEKLYKHYMVAEHFTKKIYFIASDSLSEGGSLYAADIGKGTTDVVAEKVSKGQGNITTLAVDQFTGDIILAYKGYPLFVRSLQKIPYLPQIMVSAGVNRSK